MSILTIALWDLSDLGKQPTGMEERSGGKTKPRQITLLLQQNSNDLIRSNSDAAYCRAVLMQM